MQEIVASVKRVTDIMGEISAASEEQSSGIDQVNRAVSQMDEVTQQNAALVEEAAAAAGSLQEQAQRLAEAVAVFKINAGEVIDVPAQQLAQQRRARRAAAAAPVAPKEARSRRSNRRSRRRNRQTGAARDADRPGQAGRRGRFDREALAPSGRPQGRGDRRDAGDARRAVRQPPRIRRRTMIGSLSDERSASWH